VWDTIHDTETILIASAPPKDYWVELSPDGRIAMTGFSEGAIHLWNAATGELRGEPLQLENNGMSWDFTADGKRLVLTDGNRNVTIWDSDTSKKLHEFKHDSPLRDFRAHLSPDGKWFACKGLGGELKVWDVEKGIEFRSFAGLAESPSFLFCPNGAHLAAVDKSGVVKLWDVATGRELWSVKTGVNGFALSFSPDGKRMAVRGFASAFAGSADVHILDAEIGHEISSPLQGITGHLLIFSPDGNRLITKTYDSTLKVWDIASGQETLSLKGHEGLVTGLAFSRDGHRLISVSADMTVRIWDATPLSE
jgi:WD40 repeat protein